LGIVDCLCYQWLTCWAMLAVAADSCRHCPKFVPYSKETQHG
jgi:hypothetical protein